MKNYLICLDLAYVFSVPAASLWLIFRHTKISTCYIMRRARVREIEIDERVCRPGDERI